MLRRVSVQAGSPRPGIPGLLGFSHRVTMVVSVGLVIAGVIASFAGWRQAVDSETRSEAQQLEVAAEGVAARLEAAVSTQRQLINDISGLFAASGIVTRDEFAAFAELARRTTPAPSLGLGFIRRVRSGGSGRLHGRGPGGRRSRLHSPSGGEPGRVGGAALQRAGGHAVLHLGTRRLHDRGDTRRPRRGPRHRAAGRVRSFYPRPRHQPAAGPATRRVRPLRPDLCRTDATPGRSKAAGPLWSAGPTCRCGPANCSGSPPRRSPDPVAVRLSNTADRRKTIASDGTPVSGDTHVVTARVHGSDWTLAVSPGVGWAGRSGSAELILVGGLLASAVLGLLLVSLSGAKRRAQGHADAATRRLASSEARLRATIAGAPDLILVVDADGTILSASDQAMPLLGYRPEELEGKTVEVLLPPAARQAHVHHRAAFLAGPRTRTMGEGVELAACRADGSEVPVEIALSPLVGDDGTLQVIAVVRDVTARRRAEADQRLLASFVASTREAVLTTDLDGRVTSWNSGAERLYGWPAAEALGRHVTFIAVEADKAESLARLTAIASGATFEPYQRSAPAPGR